MRPSSMVRKGSIRISLRWSLTYYLRRVAMEGILGRLGDTLSLSLQGHTMAALLGRGRTPA